MLPTRANNSLQVASSSRIYEEEFPHGEHQYQALTQRFSNQYQRSKWDQQGCINRLERSRLTRLSLLMPWSLPYKISLTEGSNAHRAASTREPLQLLQQTLLPRKNRLLPAPTKVCYNIHRNMWCQLLIHSITHHTIVCPTMCQNQPHIIMRPNCIPLTWPLEVPSMRKCNLPLHQRCSQWFMWRNW